MVSCSPLTPFISRSPRHPNITQVPPSSSTFMTFGLFSSLSLLICVHGVWHEKDKNIQFLLFGCVNHTSLILLLFLYQTSPAPPKVRPQHNTNQPVNHMDLMTQLKNWFSSCMFQYLPKWHNCWALTLNWKISVTILSTACTTCWTLRPPRKRWSINTDCEMFLYHWYCFKYVLCKYLNI